MRQHVQALGLAAAVCATAAALYVLHRRRRKESGSNDAAGISSRPVRTAPANPSSSLPAAGTAASSYPGGEGSTVTLIPPAMCEAFTLEYSLHRPGRLLRRDVELVFRPDIEDAWRADPRGAAAGLDKENYLREYLLAVPTWQPSERDLSEMSNPVNEERRSLLVNFDKWAEAVRPRLGAYWSDVSCPMEGHSRYGTPTSVIYNELEGLTSLLRYDSVPIGCCGIVLHPRWQRKAYPVTFFTFAPPEVLLAAIADAEREKLAKS